MGCRVTAGISIECDDLKRAGGLAKKIWIGNLADLRVQIDNTLSSYHTSIEFTTYASLKAFEGGKFSHEASSTLQVGEGGNVSYQHQVILRLINNDPTDDATLEDFATSDVFAIVQTNNNEFKIYGAGAGLSASAETDTSGRQVTDSSLTTITLTGVDRFKPKRFLRTDVSTTLTYLNALVG
jgi:hypothetical protein